MKPYNYFHGRGTRWKARCNPNPTGLEALAHDLKLVRKDHGYTQEELATILGRNRNTVWAWEHARGNISRRDLRKLDDLFDTVFVRKYGAIIG